MTIFKYPIQVQDRFDLELPIGAKPLTVQTQRGIPCLWVLLDEMQEIKLLRHFRLVGTGHQIENNIRLEYISSFQLQNETLIFHLFEAKL